MNDRYIFQENMRIIGGIDQLLQSGCVDETILIREALSDPKGSASYISPVDHMELRRRIYQKQRGYETYCQEAGSINRALAELDEGLHGTFLALAELCRENEQLRTCLREREFPELRGRETSRGTAGCIRKIRKLFSGEDTEEPERSAEERRELEKDIELVVSSDYYDYALSQLKNILLEINSNRLDLKEQDSAEFSAPAETVSANSEINP